MSWGVLAPRVGAAGRCRGPQPTFPPHPSPRRLLQQLEVAKCSKAAPGKSPAKAPAPAADAVTFELYWRPEQDQFAQTAKVSVAGWGGAHTLRRTPKRGVLLSHAPPHPVSPHRRSRSWRSGCAPARPTQTTH